MNWYVKVLKNYVTFSGRARRTEFWMFVLINAVVTIALAVIDYLVFGTGALATFNGSTRVGFQFNFGLLATIYSLAVALPTLAVYVRRLHDTDRSGWWIFISLVPLVGGIILLVFLASAGTRGPNRHGADPKVVPAHAGY